MPTFDFANVLRKLLAAAISAAASPVTAVLAGATLLSAFLDDILKFFNDDFSLPTLSLPEIPGAVADNELLNLFLYAVNFDSCANFLNLVFNFISSLFSFAVSFFVSVNAILIAVGVYRVIRSQLKDVVG